MLVDTTMAVEEGKAKLKTVRALGWVQKIYRVIIARRKAKAVARGSRTGLFTNQRIPLAAKVASSKSGDTAERSTFKGALEFRLSFGRVKFEVRTLRCPSGSRVGARGRPPCTLFSLLVM